MKQIYRQSRHKVRSDAFRSVCETLSLEAGGPEFSHIDETDPFWIEFVNVAMDQLVAPALADRIIQRDLTDRMPLLVWRNMEAMLRLNRSRNQRLYEEALDIADALNEIDVKPVFLKGSAGLLSNLYDEPGIRIMSDLDVLVPPDCVDACRHHLAGLGYKPAPMIRHPRNKAADTFQRRSSIAPIDLHQQVLDYEFQNILSADQILNECVTQKWHHVEYAVPSSTHQVIIGICHAQLNDRGYWYGNLPLRHLYDLVCFQRNPAVRIDWERIEDTFTATLNSRALEYHLLAARKLLDVDAEIEMRPHLMTRLFYWRSISLMGFPRLQRISFRFIRVFLLLSRELSAVELRARLRRNMADPSWWRRHIAIFWKGTR